MVIYVDLKELYRTMPADELRAEADRWMACKEDYESAFCFDAASVCLAHYMVCLAMAEGQPC